MRFSIQISDIWWKINENNENQWKTIENRWFSRILEVLSLQSHVYLQQTLWGWNPCSNNVIGVWFFLWNPIWLNFSITKFLWKPLKILNRVFADLNMVSIEKALIPWNFMLWFLSGFQKNSVMEKFSHIGFHKKNQTPITLFEHGFQPQSVCWR